MLRRLAGPFREFGIAAGALYGIHRALHAVSSEWNLRVYELTVQPITGERLLPGRLRAQFDVREIRMDDREIASMPVRPDVMVSRKRQRAQCLGAFKDGELAAYMWFCAHRYEEDEARCTYVLERGEESVFDFDFYVFPKHRVGLAFAALWNGANEFLHGRGIRHTFSRVTRFNEASRRAHARLGARIIGRVAFLQLGRFEMMIASVAPFVAMSFDASGRVSLALRPVAHTAPGDARAPQRPAQ